MKSFKPSSWLAYLGILSGIVLVSLGAFYHSEIIALFYGSITDTLGALSSTARDFISNCLYMIGTGLGIKSILKFNEYNQDPQNRSLSKPAILAVLAMAFLLPAFVSSISGPVLCDSPYSNSLPQPANGTTPVVID